MYYITINAKQITRYYINVVTRETKFHNNFHHFSMKCSNNIYASLYIIHTSVVLTLCFTLLAILFNFLRGFFSFSILATLWDFFLKRNIRGFKISEFEVASFLTDIRNFTFQNLPKTIITHYIELSPARFIRLFSNIPFISISSKANARICRQIFPADYSIAKLARLVISVCKTCAPDKRISWHAHSRVIRQIEGVGGSLRV